jgi:sporulation protein YlmC with PRC-barrel domain
MLKCVFAAAAVALAIASPAIAQERSQSQSQDRSETATKDLSMLTEKDIKGATIRNTTGDEIGTVNHVVVDPSGKVKFAVVGVGGFLGMGQKDVAVPWDRMQAGDRPQSYVLNADKEALRNAPAVDLKNLEALNQPQAQSTIASYWQKVISQQAQTPKPGAKKGSGD